MRMIFCFLLFVGGWSAQAATSDGQELLKQANQLYGEGEYRQAAGIYEQLLAEEGIAPELYYNLGNAYFKAGEVALSVLNYERALRLNPRFDDAQHNLQLARERVIDNIPAVREFFVKRWLQIFVGRFTSDQWFYTAWVLFVLFLAGALAFVFGKSLELRKIAFAGSIVFLLCSVAALGSSLYQKNTYVNHRNAVVMSGIITVKSSPDRSGTDLFELHEGTKVEVKSTLGDWVEIMIADGRMGWTEEKHIEKI